MPAQNPRQVSLNNTVNSKGHSSLEHPNNSSNKQNKCAENASESANANKYLASGNKSITLLPPLAATQFSYTDTRSESGSLT